MSISKGDLIRSLGDAKDKLVKNFNILKNILKEDGRPG